MHESQSLDHYWCRSLLDFIAGRLFLGDEADGLAVCISVALAAKTAITGESIAAGTDTLREHVSRGFGLLKRDTTQQKRKEQENQRPEY